MICWLCAPLGAHAAADLVVRLQTLDRQPLPNVVATATRLDGPTQKSVKKSAVMDQLNKAFVPQILVVAPGTTVEFPNSDTVSHQVYSFSKAKRFQLSLYKGEAHSPIQFDQPGLVVLGCNIHDSMVAYIYVADTPYFGKTGAGGEMHFDRLPAGRYRVQLWSPVIADNTATLVKDVELADAAGSQVEFRLARPLRKMPEPRPHPDGWDAY